MVELAPSHDECPASGVHWAPGWSILRFLSQLSNSSVTGAEAEINTSPTHTPRPSPLLHHRGIELDEDNAPVTSTRISTVPPTGKLLEIRALSMASARQAFFNIYDQEQTPDRFHTCTTRFPSTLITLLASVTTQILWDHSRLCKNGGTIASPYCGPDIIRDCLLRSNCHYRPRYSPTSDPTHTTSSFPGESMRQS